MKINKKDFEKSLLSKLEKGYNNDNANIVKSSPKLGIFTLALGWSQNDVRDRLRLWEVLIKFEKQLQKEVKNENND